MGKNKGRFRRPVSGLAAALALALALALPSSIPAAEKPADMEEDTWTRLQDNVLEYEEIEDLIAEYNTAVQVNQLDLNEFKRKYGNTKDDVSAKYRDMANEIYASVDYPDSDDPMYGIMVSAVLPAELLQTRPIPQRKNLYHVNQSFQEIVRKLWKDRLFSQAV